MLVEKESTIVKQLERKSKITKWKKLFRLCLDTNENSSLRHKSTTQLEHLHIMNNLIPMSINSRITSITFTVCVTNRRPPARELFKIIVVSNYSRSKIFLLLLTVNFHSLRIQPKCVRSKIVSSYDD